MRLSTKYEYFFDKSNVDNYINLKKNRYGILLRFMDPFSKNGDLIVFPVI